MGEAVRNGKNSPELWEKCLTGMWGRTLVSFVLLASASGPAQESRGVSGRRGRVSGVRRWTVGEQQVASRVGPRMVRDSQRCSHGLPLLS
jgi:hypothetical protein